MINVSQQSLLNQHNANNSSGGSTASTGTSNLGISSLLLHGYNQQQQQQQQSQQPQQPLNKSANNGINPNIILNSSNTPKLPFELNQSRTDVSRSYEDT